MLKEPIDEGIKKLAEEILQKARLIYDETASLYLIVASALEIYTGGLSLFKVRRILRDYFNKSKREVDGAEFWLKEARFLEPNKEDKRRFTVHQEGIKYTKRLLEKTDAEKRNNFISFIRRESKEIKSKGGHVNWKRVREGRVKSGLDLSIYIDEGESDRVLGALRTYGKQCGKAYAIHAPSLDLNFKVDVERMLKEIAPTYPPHFVEVEAWDPNKFNKELGFLKNPRRQLDIIFSAMPREAVITLFINLNYPRPLCHQRWIYNEAQAYEYGKGKISYSYTTKAHNGVDSNSNVLILFGENYLIRFEELGILSLYGYQKVYIGLGGADGSEKEYPIDMKSYKTMKPYLTVPNCESFEVSYTSPFDIFHKLLYYRPTEIIVSGNRVIALGIAMYYVHCLNNPELPTPKLTMAHVSAKEYSKGIGSQNIEILKI